MTAAAIDKESLTILQGLAQLPVEHKTQQELVAEVSRLRGLAKAFLSKSQVVLSSEKKKSKQRDFDMTKYSVRHVALKIAYIGENYHGFAIQDTTETTVEGQLFIALKKVCLISDRESCNYSRCGRTDKGVSALSQVVSLYLRSNCSSGLGMIRSVQMESPKDEIEIDYITILNRVLPQDIRVLGWAPIPPHFDARFSCLHRLYRYYFFKENLNIEKMTQASKYFLGEHDFRNFCKMDYLNVSNFVRRVLSVDIVKCEEESLNAEQQMFYFEVSGFAFLWHQVRCMMSVLFVVGQELEAPEIVRDLLDLAKYPRKPQYAIAPEKPLILYDCGFESLQFTHSPESLEYLSGTAMEQVKENLIRAKLHYSIWQHTQLSHVKSPKGEKTVLWRDVQKPRLSQSHIPFRKRKTEETYEERIQSLPPSKQELLKRQKVENNDE